MDGFTRAYPRFSLCGLNCGLCPMYHTDYCPGCGGGPGNQPCGVIRCSQKHGAPEYCFECAEYPCEKYNGVSDYDSFVTHRHQFSDFEKAKRIGLDAYRAALDEKVDILRHLLENYNDGRRRTFFCLAVNLLELADIKQVMAQLAAEAGPDKPLKENAATAVRLFQAKADERDITLKLRKKPRSK